MIIEKTTQLSSSDVYYQRFVENRTVLSTMYHGDGNLAITYLVLGMEESFHQGDKQTFGVCFDGFPAVQFIPSSCNIFIFNGIYLDFVCHLKGFFESKKSSSNNQQYHSFMKISC